MNPIATTMISQNAQQSMDAGNQNMNMNVTAYVVDTPKQAEIRYSSSPYYDQQTGLLRK